MRITAKLFSLSRRTPGYAKHALLAFPLALALSSQAWSGDQGETITALEDFEENAVRNLPTISHWQWSPEHKEQASRTTSIAREILPDSEGKGIVVRIDGDLPPEPKWLTVWNTRADYLPPEATAVRFRAKVVSGSFTLTCGSATVYFACSDVWAKPVTLNPGDWTTVELSLVDGIERNYRRAVFSAKSPVIHYTRWMQEQLRLMVDSASRGEILIDDVLLVSRPAKPETPFNAKILGQADLAKAFTFATDEKEFQLDTEALRKPAILEWPADGPRFKARLRGLEEMSFIGVPISAPDGANGFRLSGRVVHESKIPFVVVDFLALVSPDGAAPWPISPRSGKGFDLCLTPKQTKDTSWGFYHIRRRVPNNEPFVLDLPLVDFVCGYGQGELAPEFEQQLPLKPTQIVALSFVPPFGQRNADTVFEIDKLESVTLGPTPEPTYPQPGFPSPKN